jgi:Aldehyde dehydrogenase family
LAPKLLAGRFVSSNELFVLPILKRSLFQVAIAAAQHLTPVTLELGGKDPAIILPETNIEQWSSLWMRGILYVP